ncbi:MAG TPA: hypothetical protein VJZ00_25650, partial [Thermoanaerobaculia bacterium]|nr:hypothetical protein [Thermoanaerobaculia bacterium]
SSPPPTTTQTAGVDAARPAGEDAGAPQTTTAATTSAEPAQPAPAEPTPTQPRRSMIIPVILILVGLGVLVVLFRAST